MSTRMLLAAVVLFSGVSAIVSSVSLFFVLQQQQALNALHERVTSIENLKTVLSDSRSSGIPEQETRADARLLAIISRLEKHDATLAKQVDRLMNDLSSNSTE